MLAWDKHLLQYKPELFSLGQQQRWTLILCCIENVWPFVNRSLDRISRVRSFFESALRLLKSVRDAKQLPTAEAGDLVQDASGWLDGTTPHGTWDLAQAVVMLLQRSGKELSDRDVVECMSFSYQVILHEEVLGRLDHDVTELEVEELEEANPRCMDCIARQIRAIGICSRDIDGYHTGCP